MNQPTLLFGVIFSLANSAIYYFVGRALSQRRIALPDARLAWTLFVVWWYALAGTSLTSGLLSLLAAFGVTNLPLFVTVTQVNFLAICVALHGLMYYLLYLFTGNRRLLTPLTVFYIFYYVLLVYWSQSSHPIGVTLGRWSATLKYQQQNTGPLFVVVLLLLVIPQIIGSLAYFTLYFRVKAATQKYRILLVSWSIIIWFLSAFLAGISGLSQQDWWQLVSRVIGLSAALMILMAYQPLNWIKRRFGVTSIAEEAA
jgi:hypothetical protein